MASDEEATELQAKNQLLIADDLGKVEAVLLDKTGLVMAKGRFMDGKLQMNTGKVPNGTYFLHVGDEKNKLQLQLIVQH